jgi:alkylglycerol monooxygenase
MLGEPHLNWAALALPIFFGAVLIEARLGARNGRYAFGTAVSDLSCGSLFQAVELLLKLLTLGAYAYAYEHWRFIDHAEGSWVPWVIAFVGVDLLFYWWHRTSHVVNVLWAVHGVHHQTEDYNLAVALRQPLFEPITWLFFYLPLALLGVSPLLYLAAYALNRFYQFWIHTELVGKLGPLEWILNTPSHHRVHHAVQEQYLDRNYGAILIVWDRLFGTFEPEVEQPLYGTTVPLRSYNPLWANFSYFQRIGTLARLSGKPLAILRAAVAPPVWLPEGATDPAVKPPDRSTYEPYRPTVSRRLKAYVVIHMAALGSAIGTVFFYEEFLTIGQLAILAAVFSASVISLPALIEKRPWAMPLEVTRLVAAALVSAWAALTLLSLSPNTAALIGGSFLAISALLLWQLPERSAQLTDQGA